MAQAWFVLGSEVAGCSWQQLAGSDLAEPAILTHIGRTRVCWNLKFDGFVHADGLGIMIVTIKVVYLNCAREEKKPTPITTRVNQPS